MKTQLLARWNDAWYGQAGSAGSLFLIIAIWNTLIAALDASLLLGNPAAHLYMSPVTLMMPVLVCLCLAYLTNAGLKAIGKTVLFILSIGFIFFIITDHAELNQFMMRN
jgi:hypothetical protein